MVIWAASLLYLTLSNSSYAFSENSNNDKWYYLGGMGQQMVKQLDLLNVERNGIMVHYSTRVKTKKYYYMKGAGDFNIITNHYSFNCRGGLTLVWYELLKNDSVVYKMTVNSSVPPDQPEEVVNFLCKGIPIGGFKKGLIMSDESTEFELGKR